MDGATIRGAAATVCGQRVTDWQGATGHRRDRAEVHQGKPADAAEEQADAAALVAVVDPANADARPPKSKKNASARNTGEAHTNKTTNQRKSDDGNDETLPMSQIGAKHPRNRRRKGNSTSRREDAAKRHPFLAGFRPLNTKNPPKQVRSDSRRAERGMCLSSAYPVPKNGNYGTQSFSPRAAR